MVFAYHQVTFVACHVIPAFLRVATALWSHSTLDKTTIWFWCRSLEAVDVKSYDCQGCASECTLLPLCCHLLLSTKLPLPIAATEGDNARKPNETIKIQKRETTLPTADRSFPLHLTEDSTRCPHCTRWLAVPGKYQRPMLFSRLNLELERKEKHGVVECVTAFKTT